MANAVNMARREYSPACHYANNVMTRATESQSESESVGVGNFGQSRGRSREKNLTGSDSGPMVVDAVVLRRDTADF